MSVGARNRIVVLHGANLDQLGRRDRAHYGSLTHDQLEREIGRFAADLGLRAQVFQTNHEGEYVEQLHRADEMADGLILNPGAWTHYAWAIRDALEIAALPAVEVHLSDVEAREEWRRLSVLADVRVARVSGRGVEGYRDALERLKELLS